MLLRLIKKLIHEGKMVFKRIVGHYSKFFFFLYVHLVFAKKKRKMVLRSTVERQRVKKKKNLP